MTEPIAIVNYPKCLICQTETRVYAFVFRLGDGSFGICNLCTLRYGREAHKAAETHDGMIVAKIVQLVSPEPEEPKTTLILPS